MADRFYSSDQSLSSMDWTTVVQNRSTVGTFAVPPHRHGIVSAALS